MSANPAHATVFELDELAAGLGDGRARAHVETCATCKVRLAEIESKRASSIAQPGYENTLARLRAARRAPEPGPRRWAWAGGLGAAAALLVIVELVNPGLMHRSAQADRAAPDMQTKGGTSLELIGADGSASLSPRIGEQVELKLSAGTYEYALVIARDGSGKATTLWPSQGVQSCVAPPGGHASIRLRVTAGPAHLIAAFSHRPLSIADLLRGTTHEGVEILERDLRPIP